MGKLLTNIAMVLSLLFFLAIAAYTTVFMIQIFQNADEQCELLPTHACLLGMNQICVTFATSCEVPPLWYNAGQLGVLPTPKQSTCTALQKQIEEDIEDKSYCDTDSDCIIKELGMPFGYTGYVFVNKISNMTTTKTLYQKYVNQCMTGISPMLNMKPPKPEEIMCIQGKCVYGTKVIEECPCWDAIKRECLPESSCM